MYISWYIYILLTVYNIPNIIEYLMNSIITQVRLTMAPGMKYMPITHVRLSYNTNLHQDADNS